MGWNKRRRELIRGKSNRRVDDTVTPIQTTKTPTVNQDIIDEHDGFNQDSFMEIFGEQVEDPEMANFDDLSYDNHLGSQAEDFDCDCEYEDDGPDWDDGPEWD